MDKYRIVDSNDNAIVELQFDQKIYGEEAFCLLKEITDAVKGRGWFEIENKEQTVVGA